MRPTAWPTATACPLIRLSSEAAESWLRTARTGLVRTRILAPGWRNRARLWTMPSWVAGHVAAFPQFQPWSIEALISAVDRAMLPIQGRDEARGTLEDLERIAARGAGRRLDLLDGCGQPPIAIRKLPCSR